MSESPPLLDANERFGAGEIFLIFLKLGLTSFGGPVAHLGYFREEFVQRRKWLNDHAYSNLVALCQFLPGPASSQVGIGLGLSRGGMKGAAAAWLGFTLPSAIAMALFALALIRFGISASDTWIHGLTVVTVAVVAQALWGMGKSLCPDKARATIAVGAAIVASAFPGGSAQLAAIALGGLLGWRFLPSSMQLPEHTVSIELSKKAGLLSLACFAILLVLLPAIAYQSDSHLLKLFEHFYRAGALVFGGGHVVLPLLRSLVIPEGWVSDSQFLAGYGAAQAVPGPLFTFAAFLGAVSAQPHGHPWLGAAVALLGIFLPAFLLIVGTLPVWANLQRYRFIRNAMPGINAAVVGLLLAAFYDPVWTHGIRSASDFCLAAACFLMLVFWKAPAWLVVMFSTLAAGASGYI